jgi:geranylgeranyl pyrophosphate synthase
VGDGHVSDPAPQGPTDELLDKIERYRGLVSEAHRELIHASPYGPRVAKMLEAANRILLSREAKRIRGIISLLLAEQRLCTESYAVRCGVLVELLHFASLIHDDVIDKAVERRHEPAVNALFDSADAILVGDHFICEAIEYALHMPHSTDVIAACVEAVKALIHGIFLERRLEGEDLGFDVYRRMAELKTGVLFDLSFRLPLIGMPDEERAARVGREFGVLFQIYDDWFDRETDPGWINAYKYLSRDEGAAYCRRVFDGLIDDARAAGVLDVVAVLVTYLQRYSYFTDAAIEAH